MTKKVCVITGAAGGLGFGAAKIMGEKYKLLLSDVNSEKLDNALAELAGMGMEAEGMLIDVSDRAQVTAMAEKAKSMGTIASVIHLAGLTGLGEAEPTFRVNALGTIFINEEFYKVMEPGSAIMDIGSSAGHMIPKENWPVDLFKLSRNEDKEEFCEKMLAHFVPTVPPEYAGGMAYTYSRCFIHWYVMDCTYKFGLKGIRVVSVAPGIIETEQSKIDVANYAGLGARLTYVAIGQRLGRIEECAFLISTLVDERNTYLTGVIIPCDGGEIASGFAGQDEPRSEIADTL